MKRKMLEVFDFLMTFELLPVVALVGYFAGSLKPSASVVVLFFYGQGMLLLHYVTLNSKGGSTK